MSDRNAMARKTLRPLYQCHYCRDEFSWPAEDLAWSDTMLEWICRECWNPQFHGDPVIALNNHLAIGDASFCLLKAEVQRAREKFPSNAHLMAALMEEVGELADKMPKSRQRQREEALQVACVAVRILEEGDADFLNDGAEREGEHPFGGLAKAIVHLGSVSKRLLERYPAPVCEACKQTDPVAVHSTGCPEPDYAALIAESARVEKPLALAAISVREIFLSADRAIAAEVSAGKVPRSSALAVFAAIREAARPFDPQLAEELIPTATEKAEVQS